MPPTLSATPGVLSATCTVGATGGLAADVFAAPATGGAWALVGSRVGDGSLVVPLPAGLAALYASLPDGIPSDPVFVVVFQGSGSYSSVYTQVREAVAGRVLSLGLGLNPAGEQVYDRWADTPVNLHFPCVEMLKTGVSERDVTRLNSTNDIEYPVPLQFCDRRDAMDQSANRYYDWVRQKLVRAFAGVPLDTPRENWMCRVEFGPIAQPAGEKFEFYASLLTVWATCREVRGVGA